MWPRIAVRILICLAAVLAVGSAAIGLDEGVLTPTSNVVVAEEEREFQAAMAAWYKHKYKEGEKLLREFAERRPDSRWAAEV